MIFRIQYLILIFIGYSAFLNGQESHIKLIPSDFQTELEDTLLKLKPGQEINEVLSDYVEDLLTQNYLEVSVDSIVLDTLQADEKAKAYIHKGKKYDFSNLALDTINNSLFKEWKINPPRNIQEYIFLRKKVNAYYANNGYPFAKLKLDDLTLDDEQIKGRLNLDKGPRIIIDSLVIKGDLKLSKTYLQNYLNITEGQLYDHDKVKKISTLLPKLSFLEQEKNADLTFFNSYSTINLYLKSKNTSRFDLLFGIIPTSSIAGQQLFLSLDFTAELLNKLGYGEYLFVNFERLRPEQQQFEFKFNYPYILSLPYALDFDFSIFRNSLEYQTLKSNLGVQYLVNSDVQIKVGWDVETSNIVEIDSTFLLNSKKLPQDLDVSQNGITIEANINKLDYRFNPRRGFSLDIKGGAGKKTINRNTSILSLENEFVNFASSYDTLQLNSFRYELGLDASLFLPLALRGAVGMHLKSAWRYSDSGLFRNEKFQLGGNKLLRGFDEASFFSSYYAITTFEYRLLLSNNSYFSVPFVDVGFLEAPDGSNDMAIGVGSSLGIETKAGLFNFSVAVGRTKEFGFDFKRPKAHFGFISLF